MDRKSVYYTFRPTCAVEVQRADSSRVDRNDNIFPRRFRRSVRIVRRREQELSDGQRRI